MTVPKIPELREAEINILERCKERIENVPVRFIPVPTSHFLAGLTRCDSFVSMANYIKISLSKKDYQLCIEQEELEWLILNDFLHNDVPYLTEYKSQIYHGSPKDENVIARRP